MSGRSSSIAWPWALGPAVPAPPAGYLFLVDDYGNYLTDDNGRYLIVEKPHG